jgi:DNA-3-methyladenine glycosylase II
MRSGASTWLITCGPHASDVEMTVVEGPRGGLAPEVIRVDNPALAESELGPALASLVPLLRVRNGSLWDAIGNAILRQVIKSERARLTYQRFCISCSDPVATPCGAMYPFPGPKCVLRLPATLFTTLEMSFTRVLLRRAARAYLESGAAWSRLGPAALADQLRSIPGIGPWTAGASAADFSGNFSVYPYPDNAIRTLARRAAPATVWPSEAGEFRARWRAIAGDDVSGLTQLVLAWGEAETQPTDGVGPSSAESLPEPVDLLAVLRADEARRSGAGDVGSQLTGARRGGGR